MTSASSASVEKQSAAFNSVIAAIVLTSLKLVVGLMTGSLGILAEAAHSLLDLAAAVITFLSVRAADKPADELHHYGHGKIENLSALVETLLLLATCAWIIFEASQRLFFESVKVDASIWAFLVMGVSIAIDVSRSRMLLAAARKHKSQALEADALHFQTDIWSSSVVVAGLAWLRLGDYFPSLPLHDKADAIAALLVAVIVVHVSIQLGRRSIEALIDTAPQDFPEQIKQAVESLPNVFDCHQIRIRHSGAHIFVDLHVLLDGDQSLRDAHALSDLIEETIGNMRGNVDVTVHAEPYQADLDS